MASLFFSCGVQRALRTVVPGDNVCTQEPVVLQDVATDFLRSTLRRLRRNPDWLSAAGLANGAATRNGSSVVGEASRPRSLGLCGSGRRSALAAALSAALLGPGGVKLMRLNVSRPDPQLA